MRCVTQAFPGARVVGQTNSEASHERLRGLGITPRTKAGADASRFAHVIFCAPPSGSTDYAAEARPSRGGRQHEGALV